MELYSYSKYGGTRGGSFLPPGECTMKVSTGLFAVAAVFWIVWGGVHVLAGVMTMYQPAGLAMAGIADAVDPALLTGVPYPDAAGAILDQHGWNLAWVGMTTIVCAAGVWRGQLWGLAVAGLVGGMADLGYFLFLDLGGFVHVVPGTIMTGVSAGAIALSASAWFLRRSGR